MYLLGTLDPQTIAQQYLATGRLRVGSSVLGAVDGVNCRYITTEKFCHTPNLTIAVYLNGLRQSLAQDYILMESVPSAGWDTVVFVTAPLPGDTILVDFVTL